MANILSKRARHAFDDGGNERDVPVLAHEFDSMMKLQNHHLNTGHVSCIRVLTWNVWFDSFMKNERMLSLLCESIGKWNADVMCFQEVTPEFHMVMEKSEYIKEHYVCVERARIKFYDVTMWVRSDLTILDSWAIKLPTQQGRRCLVADIDVSSRLIQCSSCRVRIGTVHLESGRSNRSERSSQLSVVLDAILSSRDAETCNGGIILTGDFNFCSSWADENDAITENSCLADVWALIRPDDEGFTEDTHKNPMLLRSKSGCEKRVRFDRIIVASPTRPSEGTADSYSTPPSSPRTPEPLISNFKELLLEKRCRCGDVSLISQNNNPFCIPTKIDLTGTNPISGLDNDIGDEVFPSDHFGLVATFLFE